MKLELLRQVDPQLFLLTRFLRISGEVMNRPLSSVNCNKYLYPLWIATNNFIRQDLRPCMWCCNYTNLLRIDEPMLTSLVISCKNVTKTSLLSTTCTSLSAFTQFVSVTFLIYDLINKVLLSKHHCFQLFDCFITYEGMSVVCYKWGFHYTDYLH
jgi:hypothetical protein